MEVKGREERGGDVSSSSCGVKSGEMILPEFLSRDRVVGWLGDDRWETEWAGGGELEVGTDVLGEGWEREGERLEERGVDIKGHPFRRQATWLQCIRRW